MGALLAQRGWVLSDYLSGVNVELPLPARGRATSVFSERDGRPAVYLRTVLAAASDLAKLELGYFDNLTEEKGGGGWSTRFGTAGAEYMRVWSHRPATGFDDPSDGGWQFSYRFRY
jgi:hypothetical protein